MVKMLLALSAILAFFLVPSRAHAAAGSEFEIKILPLNCVFEVVDDGSNEVLYLTPETCEQAIVDSPAATLEPSGESAVPSIPNDSIPDITPFLTGGDRRAETGFSGNKTWLPVASTGQTGPIAQQNVRVVLVTATGIGIMAAVTVFVVDVAIFEMRHARAMLRWMRRFWVRV